MYCPECQVEYRAGFTECADCHVPLVETLPPETNPPEPGLELVTVLVANNPVAIALAKSSLEQAGIPFNHEGDEAGVQLWVDPHIHRWCRLQVARDRESEARALLEEIAKEDLVLDVDTEPVDIPEETQ